MTAPLIIITGPPGTGKSTVAERLAAHHRRSAVIGGDWFLESLREGRIDPWLPEAHEQNTKVMAITIRTARDYARAGFTTILEGIIGPWFLPLVRSEIAGLVETHYVVLDAPLEVCRTRVASRGRGSLAVAVTKMHEEFRAHRLPEHVIGSDRPVDEVAGSITAVMGRGDTRIATG